MSKTPERKVLKMFNKYCLLLGGTVVTRGGTVVTRGGTVVTTGGTVVTTGGTVVHCQW